MFTIKQFSDMHGLGVSESDTQATRRVAAYLRKKGFSPRTVRIEGVRARYWSKDWKELKDYKELEEKLNGLID
jgi:hypothetical protein